MNEIVRHKPRIDWMSFSWQSEFSFSNMSEHIRILSEEVFCFENFEKLSSDKICILDGNDIYIKFQSGLIFIQFRGSFFYRFNDNYYDYIKILIRSCNDYLNEIEKTSYTKSMTISRLDICQDFQNITLEKMLHNYISRENKFSFFGKHYPIYSSKGLLETYYINSGKYKSKFYRKDLEVKKENNEFKKKWFIESFGLSSPVVRYEITISETKQLKDETFIFYRSEYDEEFFKKHALEHFYLNHRIRIKTLSKNKFRWPEDEFYKSLHRIDHNFKFNENLAEVLAQDLKFSENKSIYSKAINVIAEQTENMNEAHRIERLNSQILQSISELENKRTLDKKRLKSTKRYFLSLINSSSSEGHDETASVAIAVTEDVELSEGHEVDSKESTKKAA